MSALTRDEIQELRSWGVDHDGEYPVTCERIIRCCDMVLSFSWQSIETAPKDGRKILLCQSVDADGKPIVGEDFGVFVQVAAWWGEEEGWMVYCSMIKEPTLHFQPTHWMPLPPPPSEDAKNAK